VQKLEKIKNAKEVFARHQEVQEELERHVGGLVYNITLLVAISPLESPSSCEYEEGRRFEVGIGVIVQCVDKIQESIRLVLERLQRSIFIRKVGVVIRPGGTME